MQDQLDKVDFIYVWWGESWRVALNDSVICQVLTSVVVVVKLYANVEEH
jgi:hypothetical protein